MSNKDFQPEENEILSRDDENVRRLLGSLNRVDAPKDFDFRLKARIASAKPQDFQSPRLFPALRYAAPLALVLIVLAVIVINGLYSFDNNSAPSVVENFALAKNENANSPIISPPKETASVTDTNLPAANSDNLIENFGNSDRKETRLPSKDSELAANSGKPKNGNPKTKNTDGSRDSAVTTPKILAPLGIEPNSSVPVKDVLSIIGIEANFSGGKWKAQSVREKSMAGNSGVKAGDVIEAIDGNVLTGETIPSAKTFSGNLTVVRAGERIEIKLQNK